MIEKTAPLISEIREFSNPAQGSGQFYFVFKTRGSAIFILHEAVTQMLENLKAEDDAIQFETSQDTDTRKVKMEQLKELQIELTETLKQKGTI